MKRIQEDAGRDRKVNKYHFYVAEGLPEDKGKDIVRMDPEDMKSLGVQTGDFLLIKGKSQVALKAFPCPTNFRGARLIQVDNIARENLGVSIGDPVEVEKVEPTPLKTVMLDRGGLAPDEIPSQEELKRHLLGRAVIISNKVPVVLYGGSAIALRVQGMAPPREIGLVTKDTAIILVDQTLDSKRDSVSYEDIGGLDEEVKKVRELVELPLTRPDLFRKVGIEPPKGILLYGPPGTGKTLIARAVASDSRAYFIAINGPEIMSKYYGESEARLREIFEEARKNSPAIIFIDELDAVAPKRSEVVGDVEKRVVAQLLSLMDGLKSRGDVIVIGASNMPELLDPALRRPGRFDREIFIGVPGTRGREEILKIHTRGMSLAPDVDLKKIAYLTHGYTGADLAQLCKEAGMRALGRYMDRHEVGDVIVTKEDFENALKAIEPSALREMVVEVPSVGFEDIGGLNDIKKNLLELVKIPLQHSEEYESYGLKKARFIFFLGPSGVGKSLMANAIAKEAGLNLIHITPPMLISHKIGIEQSISDVFKLAKRVSPCVLLFDRIDGTVQTLGERFTNQLIMELDANKEVNNVIIAIANSLKGIDQSLISSNRLTKMFTFNIPTIEERKEILEIILKDLPNHEVSIEYLAEVTEGLTGADLKAIIEKACHRVLSKKILNRGGGVLTNKEVLAVLKEIDFRREVQFNESRCQEVV